MKWMSSLILFLFIAACKDKKSADVSHIKLKLEIQRFDREFAVVDPQRPGEDLLQLQQKYPVFLNVYLERVLEVGRFGDPLTLQNLSKFLEDPDARLLEDSVQYFFRDILSMQRELEDAFKHVKYYFPNYQTPRIVTFTGWLRNRVFLLPGTVAVGLDYYLGRNFSLYQVPEIQSTFPAYVTRRFEPAYIPVHVMEGVLDDMYPDNSGSRPMVEQMIEKGRRLQVLKELLPEAEDSILTGYTQQQLEACYKNEGVVWGFFLQNNLLYEREPSILRDYLGDAPSTQAFGGDSPGNLGMFTGWRIVQRYLQLHPNVTPAQLMQMDVKKIFAESKYKP